MVIITILISTSTGIRKNICATATSGSLDGDVDPQVSDFLVQQGDASGHALDQAVCNPRIALGQADELLLGDDHHRTGFAGDDAGAALFLSEYRHRTEDLVLLHITHLVF